MIEREFIKLFFLFRKKYYKKIFAELQEKEFNLSANEVMCVEIIFLLRNPTLKEFADYIKISQPNATYKVNTLINKGYIERVPSARDKREFNLHVTGKFLDYYGLNAPYIKNMVETVYSSFSPMELEQFEGYLKRVVAAIDE